MSGKQSGRRVRNRKAKSEAILDATRTMIAQRGYAATTTNKIARAAQTSVGLVYKYFPGGKDEIIREIARRETTRIVASDDGSRITQENLPWKLNKLLTDYIRLHRSEARFIAAMDIALLSNPDIFSSYEHLMSTELRPGANLTAYLQTTMGMSAPQFDVLLHALLQTIDSAVHRHVTCIPVCRSDKELAVYLTGLVQSVIQAYAATLRGIGRTAR